MNQRMALSPNGAFGIWVHHWKSKAKPMFFDRGEIGISGRAALAQQLERNVAIQPAVPGAINVALCAVTDRFQHSERAPALKAPVFGFFECGGV